MAFKITKKRKSVAQGLVRTTPFILSGILALVLFHAQQGQTFDWDRELAIGLIFIGLCATVYFAVSHQLLYTKKTIIDDILRAAKFQLGGHYRINIMELITAENAFKSYFKMNFEHGYNDPAKFKQKITMHVDGVSTAYNDAGGSVVYLPTAKLNHAIDPEIKHLWSVAIKDRHRNSLAVLNIDNTVDEDITEDIIAHNKAAIKGLAALIASYWEMPA